MRQVLALFWWLTMAVGVIGTEPVDILCPPDMRFTPANILPLGSIPTGGTLASEGTTATQTDWEVEVEAATANDADQSGQSGARWKVGGNPSADMTLTASTAVPGVPGTTARYTYTDADGVRYGANEPIVLSNVQTVDAVLSGNGYRHPNVTTTPDGRIHVIEEDRTSTPGALRFRSRSAVTEEFDVTSSPWGSLVPGQTLGSSGYIADACIWWRRSHDASGYKLYVGAWFALSATQIQLYVSQSADAGATWTTYASDLVLTYSATLTYTETGIVWDAKGKQLRLVVIEDNSGTRESQTYVANDPTGARWESLPAATIADVERQSLAQFCDVSYLAVLETGATAVQIYRAGATDVAWHLRCSDTGANLDDLYGLVLVANDSGWLYLLGRDSTDADLLVMQVSTNSGRQWGAPDGTYPYRDGLATTIIDEDADAVGTTLDEGALQLAGSWGGETLSLVANLKSSSSLRDNSVMLFQFGGIANITAGAALAGTDSPFYPVGLPQDKSAQWGAFVTSGTTTQTIALDSDGRIVYRLSNDNFTGNDTYSYVGNPAVAGAMWTVGPDTTGGDLSLSYIRMGFVVHDTANANFVTVFIRLNATAGTVRVVDASGALSADAAYDNTKPLSLFGAVDGQAALTSWYFRQPGDTKWTQLTVNQSLTPNLGAATTRVTVGKLTASTAQVDTLELIPFGSGADDWVADVAANNYPASLVPIRATEGPQRLPQGIHNWWTSSPLVMGDSHVATAISRRPLALTSPLCALPSPTQQWLGAAGASGATYRLVYNLGAGIESRIAHGLVAVQWYNAGPMTAARLRRWTGSAWSTVFEVPGYDKPFGADASVSFARDSAVSLTFKPNGPNGSPAYLDGVDWVGRWVRISDGTDAILGQVLEVINPGQFSNATGVMQAAFVLDSATVVTSAGGGKASLATSTTGGSLWRFHDDGVGIGAESIDTVGYYALEWDLATGATVPQAGLFTAGPAFVLPQSPRDGSSVRRISPDEIRQLPGTGIVQGMTVRRREQRVYELPYEDMGLHAGYYAAGSVINTKAFSGSAARMTVDSNLRTIADVHRRVGQRCPVSLVLGASFAADPAVTPLSFGGQQVCLGTMAREIDVTAARGQLRDLGAHASQGGALLIAELV